jgi:acyl-[acyl-carrier-protein] desaturase
MPGAGVPDFAAHAKAIADVGVYDFTSHHDNILVPVVVKHWRLDQLSDLDAEGEEARDRVLNYIERVGRVAQRMGARRATTSASV